MLGIIGGTWRLTCPVGLLLLVNEIILNISCCVIQKSALHVSFIGLLAAFIADEIFFEAKNKLIDHYTKEQNGKEHGDIDPHLHEIRHYLLMYRHIFWQF
jgi:hypothetical protein